MEVNRQNVMTEDKNRLFKIARHPNSKLPEIFEAFDSSSTSLRPYVAHFLFRQFVALVHPLGGSVNTGYVVSRHNTSERLGV